MDLAHLAWPFFASAHRTFATEFDAWAGDHLAPFEDEEGGDGSAARAIFETLAQSNWLAKTVPGADAQRLDLRRLCLMREICAHASAMADVALSEPWLGILPLALHGSRALKARYLPDYRAGRLLPAFALSEPGAGSDVRAITTTATREGDHYRITGRKTWTSNAGLADLYVVFAKTDDGAISAFAVDGASEGIALEARLPVLSPHTVGTWRLEECRVPAARLIGAPGQGFEIAMTALALFRPTVAAAALGFARRALAEATRQSLDRRAFGKPIAEHQLIQAKLADMAVGIDAAALLVYRAAWQHDEARQPIAREAAIAKLYATEVAGAAVDQAVQIFGGRGVVTGETVERLYRHARPYRIFDGSSEIQRLIIARDILAAAH